MKFYTDLLRPPDRPSATRSPGPRDAI